LLTEREINELFDVKLESTETYGEGAVGHRDEDGCVLGLPIGPAKQHTDTGTWWHVSL